MTYKQVCDIFILVMNERLKIILENIRAKRVEKGISLRRLAKELQISVQYLSMLERGKTPMSLERFLLICSGIGVVPSEILSENMVEYGCNRQIIEESQKLSSAENFFVLDILKALQARKILE